MDDLISRQAAKKEIIETYEHEFPTASGAFDEFVTKIVPNILRNLPSAEKHGRWVLGDDGAFHCSCCEKIPVNKVFFYGMMFYDAKVAMVNVLKFCPYCGAKMEREEE